MITDNNFTDAELDAALTANPALLEKAVKVALTKREYNLRSKDEEATYLSNLETQHISKHVSAFAPQLEKAVKDYTGLEKVDATEKYFDYNARALKTLAQEKKDLDEKIKTLESTSDLSALERKQLNDAIELNKQYEKKVKEVTDGSAKEVSKAKMENKIIQQMNAVTPKLIKDTRPGIAAAQEIMSRQIKSDIENMAEEVGGKIVLKDSAGNALTNKNDGSFMTVAQYYEAKMTEAGFVDNGKTQPGAGGERPDEVTSVPGGCKTQSELLEWLRNNTMKGKSQGELLKEFDKYGHLLPR